MRVACFYFALYGSVGLILSWLPPHFRALGFSGKEIALAASVQAVLSIVVPPLWGYLADRSRRPVRVLRITTLGAALAFLPMLAAERVAAVVAVLASFHLFATALSSLIDGIAIVEARRLGTDYARLRLWGSLGFVFTSFSFGQWLRIGGELDDVVAWIAVAVAGYALVARAIREAPDAPTAKPPSLSDAGQLLRNPALLLFLAAGLVHWAALAPYHMLFALHLESVGASSTSVGVGFAAAVVAEVLLMWRFRDLRRRLPLLPILLLAHASGVLRWHFTGLLQSGPAIAAVQALHGLTYGAFFVGSLHWLEREVPEQLRITGRALFAALAFGVGGVAGNALAGVLYDAGGSALAFRAAAWIELGAPALLLASERMRRTRAVSAMAAGGS